MQQTCEFNGLAYTRISGLREFGQRLKHEDGGTVFVAQVTRSLPSFSIYVALGWFRKKTVFFGRGYLPSFTRSDKTLLDYVRQLVRTKNRLAWLTTLASSAVYKLLPVVGKYDVAFVAGTTAERIHAVDAVRISRIDHFDVDCAMVDAPPAPGLPERYAVFIDEFLPYHEDMDTFGTNPVNANDYFGSLNRFFGYFEGQHGITVVIAAHPKASYDRNPYGGRAIFYDATNALIKGAALVFAHISTAMAFAIIHQRPLCLIYCDQQKLTHPNQYDPMVQTAAVLGCPLLDIQDNRQADLVEFRVDRDKYQTYYAEYLSARDAGGRRSAEVVIDEIKHLMAPDDGSRLTGETLPLSALYSPATQERVSVEAGAGEVIEDRARLLELQIGP